MNARMTPTRKADQRNDAERVGAAGLDYFEQVGTPVARSARHEIANANATIPTNSTNLPAASTCRMYAAPNRASKDSCATLTCASLFSGTVSGEPRSGGSSRPESAPIEGEFARAADVVEPDQETDQAAVPALEFARVNRDSFWARPQRQRGPDRLRRGHPVPHPPLARDRTTTLPPSLRTRST